MRKIFQRAWFGIKFSDVGVSLSMKNIAGLEFYSGFYKEFYKRYKGYSELPKSWRILKDELVEHISDLTQENSRILSIGCGTGYVESRLCDMDKSIYIVAIEPGVDMTKWVDERVDVLHGLFPGALEDKYSSSQFDFVYASSIDYVFDNDEYSKFLRSLVDYGIDDFLLTEIFVPKYGLLAWLKEMARNLLSLLGIRSGYQFWGYLRDIDEHIEFLRVSGFSHFETGAYGHGAYWIRDKR